MKKKIRHLIFDIGNVLFKYNPQYIVESLIPHSKHKNFYIDNVFNSNDWQLMDRGELSVHKLIEKLEPKHKLSSNQKETIITLVDNFTDYLILDNDMKDYFLKMTSKTNVYILSNFQANPFKKLLAKNPFLNQAKGMVISGNVMMKKPEIGIYHYLLSQYCIIPNQALFIDDLKENINTAKKLLINGVTFSSFQNLPKHLDQYNFTK